MVLVGGVPVKRHQNAVLEYLALHSEEFCSLMMQPHEWNARIDLILEGQLAAPHLTTSPPDFHLACIHLLAGISIYIYIYTYIFTSIYIYFHLACVHLLACISIYISYI
jgi:hypothetical protein